VKSITEEVGGCLAAMTVGEATTVVARKAMEMAETSGVKATILCGSEMC
jgi:hypothetical protein